MEQEKLDTVADLQAKAAAGDKSAQFALATAYDSAYGVVLNHRKAAHWYEQAAQQGHGYAQFNLAVLYEEGLGVGANIQRAQFWYQQAAKAGIKEAQSNLGRLYASGMITAQPDYTQALHWFTAAAEAGHVEAAYNLALLYQHGLGTKKNLSRARELFTEIVTQYPQAAAALKQLP